MSITLHRADILIDTQSDLEVFRMKHRDRASRDRQAHDNNNKRN
jgi:hypothetical protein